MAKNILPWSCFYYFYMHIHWYLIQIIELLILATCTEAYITGQLDEQRNILHTTRGTLHKPYLVICTQFGFYGSYPCKEVNFMDIIPKKKGIFVDNANAGPFPWQWLGGSFVRLNINFKLYRFDHIYLHVNTTG